MQTVRELRTRLLHIESRAATLEREVIGSVDDVFHAKNLMRAINGCRRWARSLRRQLSELEGH